MTYDELSQAQKVELARLSPAGWAMFRSRANGRWRPARHLLLLNRAIVECVTSGGRLAVSMPPGHGKSELLSRATPAWHSGVWPDRRVILTSYAADLAVGFSKLARADFEEDGPEVFGLSVSEDTSAGKHWSIEGHEGGVSALGVGGALTGKHPNTLIVDDAVGSAEEALSPQLRDGLWEWWQSKASNRLRRGGAVIVLMTRWHEDDLVGRLLKNEPGRWRVLNLPAICDEPEADPLGRAEGEALWPEEHDAASLAKQKISSGTYWWSAQYQGRPTPREGGMFRRSWWKRYAGSPSEIAKSCSLIVQSWDFTFKETTDGSFVVGQVWGIRGPDTFLLDQVRDRMDFVGMVTALRSLSAKWPQSRAKLIENKANGPAVIATVQRSISGVIAIEVKGSKEARAAAHTAEVESGNVFLPDPSIPGCEFVHDFVEELAAFPRGLHDDQVDAYSQAREYLARNGAARYLVAV